MQTNEALVFCFWKKPSDLWQSYTNDAHMEKCSEMKVSILC